MDKADTLGEMQQRRQSHLSLPALIPERTLEALSRLHCAFFSCCLRFRGFSPVALYSPPLDPITQSADVFSLTFFSSFPPLALYPLKVVPTK